MEKFKPELSNMRMECQGLNFQSRSCLEPAQVDNFIIPLL